MIIVFANRRIKKNRFFSEHLFFINRYDRCVILYETGRVSSEKSRTATHAVIHASYSTLNGMLFKEDHLDMALSVNICETFTHIYFLSILNQDNLEENE